MQVCPSSADIIEHIEELKAVKKPSEYELWATYQRALKKVLYYSHRLNYNYIDDSGISQGEQAKREIEKVWATLPQELQIYLGDKAELVTAARGLNYAEGLSYERNRFSKVFPVLQKRAEANKALEATKSYALCKPSYNSF